MNHANDKKQSQNVGPLVKSHVVKDLGGREFNKAAIHIGIIYAEAFLGIKGIKADDSSRQYSTKTYTLSRVHWHDLNSSNDHDITFTTLEKVIHGIL